MPWELTLVQSAEVVQRSSGLQSVGMNKLVFPQGEPEACGHRTSQSVQIDPDV
jgi:hypothetical protein